MKLLRNQALNTITFEAFEAPNPFQGEIAAVAEGTPTLLRQKISS